MGTGNKARFADLMKRIPEWAKSKQFDYLIHCYKISVKNRSYRKEVLQRLIFDENAREFWRLTEEVFEGFEAKLNEESVGWIALNAADSFRGAENIKPISQPAWNEKCSKVESLLKKLNHEIKNTPLDQIIKINRDAFLLSQVLEHYESNGFVDAKSISPVVLSKNAPKETIFIRQFKEDWKIAVKPTHELIRSVASIVFQKNINLQKVKNSLRPR